MMAGTHVLRSTAVPSIIRCALLSRVIALSLQVLFNFLIDDHVPDVFNPPDVHADKMGLWDSVIESTLSGLRRWDSIYMIHIAEHGYTYEHVLAFFPLFPMLTRFVAFTLFLPLQPFMNARHILLLSATALNVGFFTLAACYLYALTSVLTKKSGISWIAAVLFCFNPASVFMTAAYSESGFALFSFAVMYYIEKKNFAKAAFALALATGTRSNGFLLVGYPCFLLAKEVCYTLANAQYQVTDLMRVIRLLLETVSCVICGLVPFTLFQYFGYQIFCTGTASDVGEVLRSYGRNRSYHLAGDTPSSWCHSTVPLSYSYIQATHWNVGLFHYYEWKQLPNFLLASPVVVLSLFCIGGYLKDCVGRQFCTYKNNNCTMMPYVVHTMVLLTFGVVTVHIQVLTRMIYSSSALIYVYAAKFIYEELLVQKSHFYTTSILTYHVSFFVIGIALHCNFLPWT